MLWTHYTCSSTGPGLAPAQMTADPRALCLFSQLTPRPGGPPGMSAPKVGTYGFSVASRTLKATW